MSGSWSTAKLPQAGHSKSAYSVTSTGASGLPITMPAAVRPAAAAGSRVITLAGRDTT